VHWLVRCAVSFRNWKTPVLATECGRTLNCVVIKRQRIVSSRRTRDWWMTGAYSMDIRVEPEPESQRKLTLQRLQKPLSFGVNVFAIKTSVMCESCWKEWKSKWAWPKRESCVMDVIWAKPFGNLSFHGVINYSLSVGWSMQMLMDQYQWSRSKVQSSMCVSMMITARIAGFSSSSKTKNFPSVYARSKMNCWLLITQ